MVHKARCSRTVYCLLIWACAAVSQGWAQSPSDSDTAAAIRALEREWTEGQNRNNNRALDLLFDNALVYVEYGRLLSKGEYLSRIREGVPDSDQIVTESMTIRAFGTTAIVVGTYKELQLSGGHHTQARWRFIDTWIYKKNGWVLVAAGAAPISK